MEDVYYKTSREMLWHLASDIESFCAKDDLMNHSSKEMAHLILSLYNKISYQLIFTEE